MIEHIQGPLHHLKVILRIDVVEDTPPDFFHVLHVDMRIDDDDHLAEHHLPHAPNGMHDTARLQ